MKKFKFIWKTGKKFVDKRGRKVRNPKQNIIIGLSKKCIQVLIKFRLFHINLIMGRSRICNS